MSEAMIIQLLASGSDGVTIIVGTIAVKLFMHLRQIDKDQKYLISCLKDVATSHNLQLKLLREILVSKTLG